LPCEAGGCDARPELAVAPCGCDVRGGAATASGTRLGRLCARRVVADVKLAAAAAPNCGGT